MQSEQVKRSLYTYEFPDLSYQLPVSLIYPWVYDLRYFAHQKPVGTTLILTIDFINNRQFIIFAIALKVLLVFRENLIRTHIVVVLGRIHHSALVFSLGSSMKIPTVYLG